MYFLTSVILTETRKCTSIHVSRIKIILLNVICFTVRHDNMYMKHVAVNIGCTDPAGLYSYIINYISIIYIIKITYL